MLDLWEEMEAVDGKMHLSFPSRRVRKGFILCKLQAADSGSLPTAAKSLKCPILPFHFSLTCF